MGYGVPEDYVQALKWYTLAAAQGKTNAQTFGYCLGFSKMSLDQVAEVKRLARGFRPRKAPEPGTALSGIGILDSNPSASGTGFFITEDGYLVTNNHVVEEAAHIRLITKAVLIAATVVKVDVANDLALLKAEGRFTPLAVVSSGTVRLGKSVTTVGFPNIRLQGFAPKLARGDIAALSGVADDARLFQISVPLQPGNSGGALVNESGEVVGVVSAKLDERVALEASGSLPQNVNYAVKSSVLLSLLESVPDAWRKMKRPEAIEPKFDDVVKSAEQAAVLVLVY
jgi:S1-C subfamily serine protease